MRKIRIRLRADGTAAIEVDGAIGDGCIELTRDLEDRLGPIEGPRVLKPEALSGEDPERERERGR